MEQEGHRISDISGEKLTARNVIHSIWALKVNVKRKNIHYKAILQAIKFDIDIKDYWCFIKTERNYGRPWELCTYTESDYSVDRFVHPLGVLVMVIFLPSIRACIQYDPMGFMSHFHLISVSWEPVSLYYLLVDGLYYPYIYYSWPT